jgi:TfoX/Sxy family transcriptional regulator of competence genes
MDRIEFEGMAYDEQLAARVRRILSRRHGVEEKRMVGGLSFLVKGSMCCGVTGDALMVRVGPEGRTAALRRPHARPMKMGGKVLAGFVCVEPPGIRTEAALARWVRRGLEFVATLPAAGRGR